MYNNPEENKKWQKLLPYGLVRDLNPGPLAPKARIIPLDQRASYVSDMIKAQTRRWQFRLVCSGNMRCEFKWHCRAVVQKKSYIRCVVYNLHAFYYQTVKKPPKLCMGDVFLQWSQVVLKGPQHVPVCWLVGLGVWFSLRVREVPGSNPGRAHKLLLTAAAKS